MMLHEEVSLYVLRVMFVVFLNPTKVMAMDIKAIIEEAKKSLNATVVSCSVTNASVSVDQNTDRNVNYWTTFSTDGQFSVGVEGGVKKASTVPVSDLSFVSALKRELMAHEETQELVLALPLVSKRLKAISIAHKQGIELQSAFLTLLQGAKLEILQYPVEAGKKYKSLFSLNEQERTCERTSVWHDIVSIKLNAMRLVTLKDEHGMPVFDEHYMPVRVPILALLYREVAELQKAEVAEAAALAEKTKAAAAIVGAAHAAQLNNLV